ncbi:MAG: acyl-CoA thioesterase, partial [Mycobacterium sp.]|nr:acyl-CoA thioesterase [Mycobacterium sp.]
MSTSDLEELLAVLDLQRVDDDTFTGSHPSKNPIRTFGGQMMAQAFVAASRTLKHDLPPSTLSVHFIAGGDPERDLEFHVVRLRDERRFANRRVDVMQGDVLLASALVSHLAGGRGLEHGVVAPDVPGPLSVPRIDDLLVGYEETVPHFVAALKPIEWRYTNDPAWVMRDKGERLAYNRVWLRAKGETPDDQVIHAAALVYSSDTTVLDSIITTHGLSWGFDRIFAVTMN